eukprot:1336610-Rhodomonas_salina.11
MDRGGMLVAPYVRQYRTSPSTRIESLGPPRGLVGLPTAVLEPYTNSTPDFTDRAHRSGVPRDPHGCFGWRFDPGSASAPLLRPPQPVRTTAINGSGASLNGRTARKKGRGPQQELDELEVAVGSRMHQLVQRAR